MTTAKRIGSRWSWIPRLAGYDAWCGLAPGVAEEVAESAARAVVENTVKVCACGRTYRNKRGSCYVCSKARCDAARAAGRPKRPYDGSRR